MKKGRFLWSAHRITERQKAGKARSIKGKQLKNSRNTASKPLVAHLSSARDNLLFKPYQKVYKTPENQGFRVTRKYYFPIRRHSPIQGLCRLFLFIGFFLFVCGSVGKWISPTKLKTISTFWKRLPSIFSGAWTMIFFTNSLTIVGVNSVIPTYLRIMAAKLSKSLLFCS